MAVMPKIKKNPPKKKPAKKKSKKWFNAAKMSLTLTSDIVEAAAEMSHKALFAKQIAAKLGVPHNTYKSWIERGREEIAEFEKGDRLKSRLTLKSKLVIALGMADADMCLQVHTSILDDENGEVARANDQKIKLLKLRHPKDYGENREQEGNNIIENSKDILLAKLMILREDA